MRIYTDTSNICFTSEQIILFGLLHEYPREPPHCYNFEGESRYNALIEFCSNKFTYVSDINKCDVIVLPHKFKGQNDPIFKELNKKAEILSKPLLCFFNDDYDKPIKLGQNVTLYRTSFYKTIKFKNEKAMPAFCPDYYKGKILENFELSIGYCGHILHGRKKYLNLMLISSLKTNFILRKGFWALGINKQIARKEFIHNMENNLFIFCYRGAGNFSYRFYETLMMGRIPILIDTDCVFPHDDKVDIGSLGVVIKEKNIEEDPKKLLNIIIEYYKHNKHRLVDIQKRNRQIWEDYYSPKGFLTHLLY